MVGANGFEPSTSWSRTRHLNPINALFGVAYGTRSAISPLLVVPNLYLAQKGSCASARSFRFAASSVRACLGDHSLCLLKLRLVDFQEAESAGAELVCWVGFFIGTWTHAGMRKPSLASIVTALLFSMVAHYSSRGSGTPGSSLERYSASTSAMV